MRALAALACLCALVCADDLAAELDRMSKAPERLTIEDYMALLEFSRTENGATAVRRFAQGLRPARPLIPDAALTELLTFIPQADDEGRSAAVALLLAVKLTDEQAERVAQALGIMTDGPWDAGEHRGTDDPPPIPRQASDEPLEPREVVVFFGTDRKLFEPDGLFYAKLFLKALIAAVIAIVLPRFLRWALHPRLSRLERVARWFGWSATAVLSLWAFYTSVRVYQKHERLGFEYGSERGTFDDERYCHLGRCVVGIPPQHLSGEIERPRPLAGDFWEDPQKHVMLLKILPEENKTAFFDAVKARAEEHTNEAFVFVHGFSVTFEDAALRTAQMHHDLNFQGAPIFYSWPSQGSVLGYTADESTVAWATRHLQLFLRDLRVRLPGATIHLVAHSMGNRALTEALRRLSMTDLPRFQEVVLAAPDIDADTFRNDIAPLIRRTASRVTLYASSADEALAASKTIHGYPRAGESGDHLVVVDAVQTIDVPSNLVTSILGHSYYGSVGRVLEDLVALLRHRKSPQDRGLEKRERGKRFYWRLK